MAALPARTAPTSASARTDFGGRPFLVLVSDSHDGGTPEAQREGLMHCGVTEQSLGVSVVSSLAAGARSLPGAEGG